MAERGALVFGIVAAGAALTLAVVLLTRPEPEPAPAPASQPASQPAPQPEPRPEPSPAPTPTTTATQTDTEAPQLPQPGPQSGPGDALEQAAHLARDLRRFDEALELLEGVFDADPNNPAALELLAEIHVERGESHQAFPLYLKLVSLQPERPELRLPAARIAREHGDCRLAEDMLREALERELPAAAREQAEALLRETPSRCRPE